MALRRLTVKRNDGDAPCAYRARAGAQPRSGLLAGAQS